MEGAFEAILTREKKADKVKRRGKEMERRIGRYVTEKEDGYSLQHFLRASMRLSQREISRAKFRENGICVNKEQKKVSALLRAGELVEVLLEPEEASSPVLAPSNKGIRVLYEDCDVIVLDKPAGVLVHPAGKGSFDKDTLANRLACYLREKGEDSVIRFPGRLDKDTSGVILATKNQAAAARIERQREEGMLVKTYFALTDGVPERMQGEITVPIEADPSDRTRMRVSFGGKRAVTRYEVLKTGKGGTSALLKVRIETGRMHQIRVHMAYEGTPLLGDSLYGRKDAEAFGMGRTALHAGELLFYQPFEGRQICVKAPLPKDVASVLCSVIE